MIRPSSAFWAANIGQLLDELGTSSAGLTTEAVLDKSRRAEAGVPRSSHPWWGLLLAQFRSPITIILIGAAILSCFLHEPVDAGIILLIVLVSALLGFWQEYAASSTVRSLLALISTECTVIRDRRTISIPTSEVVVGDVVQLSAGDAIPADCRLLEARDLFVNEAALTGETFPVEKDIGEIIRDAPLANRSNCVWQGTHVVSGTALAVVAAVGRGTQFGSISQRLRLRPPETDFEHGVRHFGYLLMELTMLLVLGIFAVNVYFQRPVIDAFLFAMALAVGLTPQLLPAIITVNLSYGARRMARQQVIVRRLAAIEDFGGMDVLCSDKTGTLTTGTPRIQAAVDGRGQPSERAMLFAYINSSFETGFVNPIDVAIREFLKQDISGYRKLDEIPYDFARRRLSVFVTAPGENLLITKGAVDNVLEVCERVECADGTQVRLATCSDAIRARHQEFGEAGFRTLGIAYRIIAGESRVNKEAESGMTFVGFLVLEDPPKPGIADTIRALHALGVGLKVITGDSRRVAASLARQVGLMDAQVMTGADLRTMTEEALIHRVRQVQVFAEVEPNQKERVIRACQKAGHVVGYLGDGINDATALHAANVGISVKDAVDVAKEAADIVLLRQDLAVLLDGVREGRKTFANTMKYVFMATSANFGNMFSMAAASLFLNYLPLLPKQILLMNLLTDLPEMAIASDCVDAELIQRPRHWNVGFIRRFMLVFGPLSSVFDFLTFAVLLNLLQADASQFRTAWFMESVISASLAVLVVRTWRPVTQSRPGRALLWATLLVGAIAASVPWWPWADRLGFSPLPSRFLWAIALIIPGYVLAVELTKTWFRRIGGNQSADVPQPAPSGVSEVVEKSS